MCLWRHILNKPDCFNSPGRLFWQRQEDSNHRQRFWRPPLYPLSYALMKRAPPEKTPRCSPQTYTSITWRRSLTGHPPFAGLPLDRTHHFRGITKKVVWQPELHRRHGEAPRCPFYARGISKIERSRTGNQKNRSVERLSGIEPPSPGWRPGALPMSYSRMLAGRLGLPTVSGGNVNETRSVQKGGPPFCAIPSMAR